MTGCMADWITIDGSQGEGGGQILRSALALSCVTARPFRIMGIRAGRRKPGLLRQHLTAVQAVAAVSGATLSGAELGSQTLSFVPSRVRGGEYRWSVGTAGSATLVLQAVLPALLLAGEPSRLVIDGGTHNPYAPPFEFLAETFLPTLRRMGATVDATLERHGFHPAGGGRIGVTIQPCEALRPLALLDRGDIRVHARALVAALPHTIGRRELAVVRERLGLAPEHCHVDAVDGSIGPGNVLLIGLEDDLLREVVTGFGMKGVTAEAVAAAACDEAEAYLAAGVPVGIHLADQLLMPLALAGGGTFRTLPPTPHTLTNAAIITRFLDVRIRIAPESGPVHRVVVGPAAGTDPLPGVSS